MNLQNSKCDEITKQVYKGAQVWPWWRDRRSCCLGGSSPQPSPEAELGQGSPCPRRAASPLMETGIMIFRQVVITIVVAENNTPIRL